MNKNERDFRKEREPSAEKYRMVRIGGRIKSASVSLDHLYKAAAPLIREESPLGAMQASLAFAKLRGSPPLEFRKAFFPQDEKAMRAAFSSVGILRPTIKTDQGPPGNVGYFFIRDGESQLEGRIAGEEGVAVVENFLRQRLNGKFEGGFEDLVRQVQISYQNGDYRGAYAGILEIRNLGQANGIETVRRAGVGRGEFFFFRPVKMEQDIVVGTELAAAISKKTEMLVAGVENMAKAAKKLVQSGLSVEEAVKEVRRKRSLYFDYPIAEGNLLYFQPDVLIRRDGSFDIERVNMPDLGMFLTEVDSGQNESLSSIQDINLKIREEIIDAVINNTSGELVLLTRDEVVEDLEDTLEQMEIASFGKALVEKGRRSTVAAIRDAVNLPYGSEIILFNVSPQSPFFETLLQRVAKGELNCYPDPFIKLFEREATSFRRLRTEGVPLEKFIATITPSSMDKPEGVLAKYKAIQRALGISGIEEDVIYFSTDPNNGYIPTFRYDSKVFFEVKKALDKQRERGEKPLLITTPVPFKPEDALIFGNDGARLAFFRFAFVRR